MALEPSLDEVEQALELALHARRLARMVERGALAKDLPLRPRAAGERS